ncbi:MAG: 2-dehydropantoate 2-reductase [Bradyrhizobiaceae bacterium]|nr:MAG: 2-dehydropantoate 2-reductase [Bradyrhizobiaceae bacterium]
MRIVIMGTGGVGGYFGARLAQGGADVTFVARGAHLAAIRAHGLTVESTQQPIHLQNVKVTDDPATIGPVDLVMFGVKLWDTEAAARALAPVMGPQTALISFQNGVQKDDLLRPVVGDAALAGGVAYVAATVARPGVIAQTGAMQRLVFGEFDGRRSARMEAFHAACVAGGINAEISGDIRRAIWEKFVFLAALSGATAAIRLPVGPIRANPATRQLLRDLLQEVVAVGRAHGVALPEDYAMQRLAFIDTLSPDMTASMHHDLAAGRRLELAWLSGGVVELGEAVGVPAPVHRVVRDVLLLHADGRTEG